MPTRADWDELCNTANCTWTWYSSVNTEFGGVAGYKVTSKITGYTDNYIFLPAAGLRSGTGLTEVGSYGDYWSSSLNTSGPYSAYDLFFDSDRVDWYSGSYRRFGLSVRPVCQ